jgi:hypothetical protein
MQGPSSLAAPLPMLTAKRWVVVAPRGGKGAALLLAQPKSESERAAIGNQAGGRVFLFLQTETFLYDYERWKARGWISWKPPGRSLMEPLRFFAIFMETDGTSIQPRAGDLIKPSHLPGRYERNQKTKNYLQGTVFLSFI